MSGFSNAVMNGVGTLVRTLLKSANYAAGSTGWQVKQDGTAEFNNVVIRGNVVSGNSTTGPYIIIDQSVPEIRIYDSTDTLVASINATGVIVTAHDGSQIIEQVGISSQAVIGLYPPGGSGAFGPNSAGIHGSIWDVAGGGALVLTSPVQNGSSGNQCTVQIAGASTQPNPPQFSVTTVGGPIILNAYALGGGSTNNVVTSPLAAVDPSIGPMVAETWHSISFANGWVANGGTTPAYRMVASPAKSLQWKGSMTPGTKADGTTVFTLPAAWRPVVGTNVAVVTDATVSGGQLPHFDINASTGVVRCWGCANATSVSFSFGSLEA